MVETTVAQTRDSLEKNITKQYPEVLSPAFSSTRIANAHTVEQLQKGVLDVRINHRFGSISDGAANFFGLDNAATQIGFDYGITDKLMLGIGRSSLNKEYNGYGKLRLLSQKTGGVPLTLSYLAGIYVVSEKAPISSLSFFNRVTYLHQALAARRFNDRISLQLVPTLVHFNATDLTAEKNTIGALGLGGRYKLTKKLALTAEYFWIPDAFKRTRNVNPLTIGVDIETYGHVFQMFFSNAAGSSERALFTSATSGWEKGRLHFGFNISRVFNVRR
ncbi:DUF5777 family beta-barrel protein [Niabella aquatica]